MTRNDPKLVTSSRASSAKALSRGCLSLGSQDEVTLGSCCLVGFLRGLLTNHDTPLAVLLPGRTQFAPGTMASVGACGTRRFQYNAAPRLDQGEACRNSARRRPGCGLFDGRRPAAREPGNGHLGAGETALAATPCPKAGTLPPGTEGSADRIGFLPPTRRAQRTSPPFFLPALALGIRRQTTLVYAGSQGDGHNTADCASEHHDRLYA